MSHTCIAGQSNKEVSASTNRTFPTDPFPMRRSAVKETVPPMDYAKLGSGFWVAPVLH